MQPSCTITTGGALGLCVALTSVVAGTLGSVFHLYLYPLSLTPHRLVSTELVQATPLDCVAGIGYRFSELVDASMLFGLLIESVTTVIFTFY